MPGLMDLIAGGLRPQVNVNRGAMPRGYKSYLRVTDGDAAYDTAAEVFALCTLAGAAGVWYKIWEMTVPAQQMIRWGYGSPAQPYNQGYMWFCSLDSGTDFTIGTIRLQQARARDREPIIVAEIDDTRLHGTTVTTLTTATPVNINEMVALPEKVEFPLVGEDSLMQIWYLVTTAATAEDNVGFSIPVTRYNL